MIISYNNYNNYNIDQSHNIHHDEAGSEFADDLKGMLIYIAIVAKWLSMRH